MKIRQELYYSVDCETDGPVPGEYSMLSFGTAVFDKEGQNYNCGTFEKNLELLPLAKQDPKTMEWWATQTDAYSYCRQNLQDPKTAIMDYVKWIKNFCGNQYKPVFIGFPVTFDFGFVQYYLHKFTGESPFSFAALDIKTFAMSVLDLDYTQSVKRNIPHKFKSKTKHSHTPLQDAIEQGELFINLLKFRDHKKLVDTNHLIAIQSASQIILGKEDILKSDVAYLNHQLNLLIKNSDNKL